MRHEAERLRAERHRLTGASKPGTRRRYELVVGAAKARIAGACLRMPPMACRPRSLRPAYFGPAKRFLPPFQSEMCVCMPLPLSSKIGLGMNVTVLPCLLGDVLADVLVPHHLVAHPEEVAEPHVNLALPGGGHFVVVRLDLTMPTLRIS